MGIQFCETKSQPNMKVLLIVALAVAAVVAEPEADPKADAAAYYYGGYYGHPGYYGYGRYGYGGYYGLGYRGYYGHYLGKRSADAEPEADADAYYVTAGTADTDITVILTDSDTMDILTVT